jgi:hypothetical protein
VSRGLDIDDRDRGASGDSTPESGTRVGRAPDGSPADWNPARGDSVDRPRSTAGLTPGTCLDHALSRGLDEPRELLWRDRVVSLTPSEGAALRALGIFRTVALSDLARHQYDGDRAECTRELRRLDRRHFVEAHTLPARHGGRATPVVTLTREGMAFTRRYLVAEEQRLHRGLVQPKEQAHDAALYRIAVVEAERLEARGGSVRRVILDAELKGQLAAMRNRPGGGDPSERTLAAARELYLQVVDGRVQVPDLRLEYEARDGAVARVDLELATEHYKPGQIAAKAAAGFTIYAPPSQTARLTAALQDRGLVGHILSL